MITDLDRLLSSTVNSDGHCKFHCTNCFRMSMEVSARDDCQGTIPDPIVIMPTSNDKWIKFTNYSRQLHHTRAIYLDLNAMQLRQTTCISPTQTNLSTHIPCRACCYTHDACGPGHTFLFWGEDCIKHLIDHLASEAHRFVHISTHLMARLTPSQISDYSKAMICHICEMPLGTERV